MTISVSVICVETTYVSWYILQDGEHISTAPVLIRVKDTQNTAPVFVGAMSGRIMEDSPVGSLVMIIEARDGDLGIPRNVKLTLLTSKFVIACTVNIRFLKKKVLSIIFFCY